MLRFIGFFALGLGVAIVFELGVGVVQVWHSPTAGLIQVYGLLCLFVIAAIGRYSTLTLSRILIITAFLAIPLFQFPLLYYFGRGLMMMVRHEAYRDEPTLDQLARVKQDRERDIEQAVARLRRTKGAREVSGQ